MADNDNMESKSEAVEVKLKDEDIDALFQDPYNSFGWLAVVGFVAFVATGMILTAIFETLSLVDNLYFVMISITTVGYGDFYPVGNAFKIMWSIYLLVGFGLAATLVATFTSSLWVWQDNVAAVAPSKFATPTKNMAIYTVGWLFLVLIGLVFFQANEPLVDWSMSFGHVITTLTTVGYGDGPFGKPSTHLFTIFYAFFGVGYTAAWFSAIVAWVGHLQTTYKFEKLQKYEPVLLASSLRASREETNQGKGTCDRNEFVMHALLKGGRVHEGDLQEFEGLFNKLDTDNSGFLELHEQ